MSIREEFDEWARRGKDKGMEQRHWHTVKPALARMPIEAGETVLDLGTGSGYVLRALRETASIANGYGLDASPEMLENARSYTADDNIGYVRGDFEVLPFATGSIDHIFTMEAFYYARDPHRALEEVRRVLRSGGTFYCAVDFFEESVHTHHWQDNVGVEMTCWSEKQYRDAFRDAGLVVAQQDRIPDRETEIPPEGEFPHKEFESREEMVERFREHGTLLTVGVCP